jgi:hypothetical protein
MEPGDEPRLPRTADRVAPTGISRLVLGHLIGPAPLCQSWRVGFPFEPRDLALRGFCWGSSWFRSSSACWPQRKVHFPGIIRHIFWWWTEMWPWFYTYRTMVQTGKRWVQFREKGNGSNHSIYLFAAYLLWTFCFWHHQYMIYTSNRWSPASSQTVNS